MCIDNECTPLLAIWQLNSLVSVEAVLIVSSVHLCVIDEDHSVKV